MRIPLAARFRNSHGWLSVDRGSRAAPEGASCALPLFQTTRPCLLLETPRSCLTLAATPAKTCCSGCPRSSSPQWPTPKQSCRLVALSLREALTLLAATRGRFPLQILAARLIEDLHRARTPPWGWTRLQYPCFSRK